MRVIAGRDGADSGASDVAQHRRGARIAQQRSGERPTGAERRCEWPHSGWGLDV